MNGRIKVATVCAKSDRTELFEQMTHSLKASTHPAYELFAFAEDGMKDGEMKTVNRLIAKAGDWDYLVRTDDDMYFGGSWLPEMIRAYKNNPDVWLLGGCKYPRHKVIEEREDILITEICAGNHWLMSRENYEKVGGFYEDFIDGQPEDVRYSNKIQEMGGKVAHMKDRTLVVHCGIIGTNGKGRSEYVNGYSQALADVVGAKTNLVQK